MNYTIKDEPTPFGKASVGVCKTGQITFKFYKCVSNRIQFNGVVELTKENKIDSGKTNIIRARRNKDMPKLAKMKVIDWCIKNANKYNNAPSRRAASVLTFLYAKVQHAKAQAEKELSDAKQAVEIAMAKIAEFDSALNEINASV